MLAFAPACAIRYFDARTNTVHWWGVGHFAAHVSTPENGVQAAAVSGDVVGIAAHTGDSAGFGVGFDRWQRLWITQPDVAFRLYGPGAQLIELNAAGLMQPKESLAPAAPTPTTAPAKPITPDHHKDDDS